MTKDYRQDRPRPDSRRGDSRNRAQRVNSGDGPATAADFGLLCLPADTGAFVGNPEWPSEIKCDSRSLLLERFANPQWKDDGRKTPRRDFLKSACGRRSPDAAVLLESWLKDIRPGGRLAVPENGYFQANLNSRLMVNMAGGVLENAGLCLDRLAGEPYIPGSAVKGCARRAAIQDLLSTPDDQKGRKLADIALTFGWGVQDFRTRAEVQRDNWETDRSDFAFACGDQCWGREFVERLKRTLWREIFKEEHSSSGEFLSEFERRLGHFKGQAQFLPAYPIGPCVLELDIVTCHHPNYYAGAEGFESAPDTEEPRPVVFPAVAAGSVFAFAVISANNLAIGWLKEGLQDSGIGAKTNAGYGWFEVEPADRGSTGERTEREARRPLTLTVSEADVAALASQQDDQISAKINDLRHETDYAKPEILALLKVLAGPKRGVLEALRSNPSGRNKKRLDAIEAAAKELGVDLS